MPPATEASEGAILCVYGDKLVYSGQGYDQGRTFREISSNMVDNPETIRVYSQVGLQSSVVVYKAIQAGESSVAGESGDRAIDEPILRRNHGEPSMFLDGDILQKGDKTYSVLRGSSQASRPADMVTITCVGHLTPQP